MSELQTTGTSAASASPHFRGRSQGLLGRPWAGVAMLLVLYLLLIGLFTALSPFFLTFKNLLSIGSNMAFIGLMAAAGTPLIIAGGLDLSVAAVAGIAGVIVAMAYSAGVGIWIACVLALIAGGLIGAANGAMTNGLRLNPFIVTLGTMSIITGASLVLTGGLTQPLLIPGFNWIGSGRIGGTGGVPVPLVIMLAAFALIWWV